jgi:hypothetical protein
MPPPVWYCNYPTGEYVQFTFDPTLSGLGIQETGDCIRWRPPAYRGFIQHIPQAPNMPANPSPYTAWESRPSPPGPVSLPSQHAQNLPQEHSASVRSTTSTGSPRAGKTPKHRGSIHRYNNDVLPPPPQPKSSPRTAAAEQEDEDVSLVDNVDDLFNDISSPPAAQHGLAQHGLQLATSSGSPQHEPSLGDESMQTWYYDAEALARIEFPSVNRRIDTDNITLGAPANTATGFGEYSTAAATAGGFQGSGGGVGSVGTAPGGGESEQKAGAPQPSTSPPPGNMPPSRSFYRQSSTPVRQPLNSAPSTPTADNMEEGRGRDWVLQSAGMGSYYDLLNPSRGVSPMGLPHSASRASLRMTSPALKDRSKSAALNGSGIAGDENKGTLVEQSVPFSQPPSQYATSDPSLEVSSTNSLEVSPTRSTSSPEKSSLPSPAPIITPMPSPPTTLSPTKSFSSRIPVAVRSPSSANVLLSDPVFPPGVNAPNTSAAPVLSPTSPDGTQVTGVTFAVPAATVNPRASGVFSNPLRPHPIEIGEAKKISIDTAEETSSAPQPSQPPASMLPVRTKSKKDMYVSPYKQALRGASSTASALMGVDPISPIKSPVRTPSKLPSTLNQPGEAETVFAGSSLPRTIPQYGSTGVTNLFPGVADAPAGTVGTPPQPASQQKSALDGSPMSAGPPSGKGGAEGRNRTSEVGWSSYGGHGGTEYGIAMGPPQPVYDSWQSEERSMVQRYMRDRQVEIIVVVEGVDAATGGMVQARHSYTSDEIEWDRSFQCCVFKDPIDGFTTIDFSLFHETLSVPTDAPFAGVVHSSI